MKTRFGTVDLMAICHELQEKLVGMRVNQIYDIDKKTYLIRLQRTEEKAVLLFESGTRIHLTNYEWPKQPAPSGFTMKLRKHIKNKRLESLRQLGVDRIVDMQFGTGDASYHVILELYDRGNIIFTDHEFVILNLLRPRTDNEDQRIAVGEKYPMDKVRGELRSLDVANWDETVSKAKPNDNLKKLLNPRLDFGPSLIEHCLLGAGFPPNAAIDKGYKHPEDAQRILEAMKTASELCRSSFKGYIVQKVEKRLKPDGSGEEEDFFTYQEYHPHKYSQYDSSPLLEFPGFSAAVDEFYSKMENQKVDLKVVQQEKMAMKKLENVIKDRENRLAGLQDAQDLDRQKGEMIQMNLDLVEKALLVLRSAIANQMSWEEIGQMVKDAQARGDPIASTIRQLKLEMNHFTMALRNPYETPAIAEEKEDDEEIPVKNEEDEESEKSEEEEEKAGGDEPAKEEDQEDMGKKTKKGKGKPKKKPKDKGGKDKKKKKGEAGEKVEKGRKDGVMLVDIDIALSAFANARRYYDQKRHAALKEQKTLESTDKAFKSAQKKTKQVLKEVQAIASVNKARKPMWFEKFYWFISSENYLVIGGRDQQQNELIVKRYLRQNDIYVHADLHGASSVVIKNPKEGPVQPKTLNEAGTMAICYSSAWDAKVITNAWWVYANQVSKTAPTGEYLTTGSFMIRGKKNLMMPSHLIMGFGFLFKLEESSVLRHKGERRVKTAEEEAESLAEAVAEDLNGDGTSGDVDIPMEEGDDEDEEEEEASGLKGPEVDETKAELEQIREEADDEHAKEDGEKSGSETEEENDKSEESAEEEEEGKAESTPANVEFEFPDTKVTVVGDKLETKGTKGDSPEKDEEEVVIYLGDDKPLVLKPSEQRKKQQQKAKQLQQQQNNPKDKKAGDDKSSQQQNAPAGGDFEKDSQKPYKRGQKAKMKRVKEKYKDQDEEERKLRMVLHHQSISGKELNPKTKRGKKAKALEKQREDERRKAERAAQLEAKQKQNESKAKAKKADGGEELDIEDDDDDDKKELDDLSVLDTFTGAPVAEDELLFALPVVAPYAVFTNYKYKLKMTPGGAKRGKATKTALNIFAHDKAATQREKDLLKCVKEHDLTRNFPGKVKLSATTQQRKR